MLETWCVATSSYTEARPVLDLRLMDLLNSLETPRLIAAEARAAHAGLAHALTLRRPYKLQPHTEAHKYMITA
jgi:hypothetical protein